MCRWITTLFKISRRFSQQRKLISQPSHSQWMHEHWTQTLTDQCASCGCLLSEENPAGPVLIDEAAVLGVSFIHTENSVICHVEPPGLKRIAIFSVHLKSHQDPSKPIKLRSNQSRWRMQSVRPVQHMLTSDQSHPAQNSGIITQSIVSGSDCYFDRWSRYFARVTISAWDEDKPCSLGNGDICAGCSVG